MPKANRIFTDAELKDFQKDCMDLALEAIEKGDLKKAKYWCRKQTETKDLIHDLYLHWVTALLSHVHEKFGEDAAVVACRDTARNFSIPFARKKAEITKEGGLRPWIEIIIDLWRQHTMYPGFRIEEDDEKFILTMNPCGSGGRLINMGAYDGALGYKKLKKAGPHTWGETDVPIYCSHCPWVHEIFPIQEVGQGGQLWVHAVPFPKKPGDPCVYHIYKDPKDIPAKYYERIGLRKEA